MYTYMYMYVYEVPFGYSGYCEMLMVEFFRRGEKGVGGGAGFWFGKGRRREWQGREGGV